MAAPVRLGVRARPPDAPAGAGACPPEKVLAARQAFQESQARLRQYEWIETTVVSYKGEQKSSKQMLCYYGVEGALQKVPVDTPEAAEKAARELGTAVVAVKAQIHAGGFSIFSISSFHYSKNMIIYFSLFYFSFIHVVHHIITFLVFDIWC